MKLKERLHENVYRYENAIEDPAALIKAIEDTESNPDIQLVVPLWKNWESSSRDGVNFGSKKDLNVGNLNDLDEENKQKAEYIINTIRDAIKRVAEAFVVDRGLNFTPTLSPFVGISKYLPGCYMGAHFDAQAGDQTLKYSMIFYLNDNYEGGEISFIIREPDLRLPENGHLRPKDDINDPENKNLVDFYLKPNAGDALIFPSTAPYRHQVHLMKEGEKYIIPGFIFTDGYVPEGY
jgi:hypothetical protein